jgi:predicted ATPase
MGVHGDKSVSYPNRKPFFFKDIQEAYMNRGVNDHAISSISVHGFKSLIDMCTVDLRNLTLLAGANSSGKSSIMQPLLMMKQTIDDEYNFGDLKINGPHVKFTLVDQFLSKVSGKEEERNEFEISIRIGDKLELTESFSKKSGKKKSDAAGIEISKMIVGTNDGILLLRPEAKHEEIRSDNQQFNFKTVFRNILPDDRLEVKRDRCFLGLRLQRQNLAEEVMYGSFPFAQEIRRIIHVPAFRGNPERNYQLASVGEVYPGTFDKYIASIIHEWQKNGDHRLDALGKALLEMGLTWKVRAEPIDDAHVKIDVGRLPKSAVGGGKDMVSIADVGFGVSQTLPVIVALLAAGPGQLVYIEQPEIHLHPRAQIAIAKIMADAANRGVRVVAETHSSYILLGVQTLVAEGYLSPENVKLHWFKRRSEDGGTEVLSADLDRAGAFGDWPEDFADVELTEQSRYMDAAQKILES